MHKLSKTCFIAAAFIALVSVSALPVTAQSTPRVVEGEQLQNRPNVDGIEAAPTTSTTTSESSIPWHLWLVPIALLGLAFLLIKPQLQADSSLSTPLTDVSGELNYWGLKGGESERSLLEEDRHQQEMAEYERHLRAVYDEDEESPTRH
jgi:hypothetical protein